MVESGIGKDPLFAVLEKTWDVVREIEPAHRLVSSAQVLAIRDALAPMVAEHARWRSVERPDGEVEQIDGVMATIYARAAAAAIAAGDEANAERWLAAAEPLSRDDDQRAEIAAARRSHERYRALVHGRNMIAKQRESDARRVWKSLTDGEPDAITRAARAELAAPRALGPDDNPPALYRFNGIGVGFYGRRDEWPDGSYATTHCFSLVWIPIIPLSAWRVRDEGDGYSILAREQLSRFARIARWAMPTAIVLTIALFSIVAYINSPERLARQRWDDALEVAQRGDPETALRQLDGEIERDLSYVDAERAQRAGAEIVRLSAGYVAEPFAAAKLDQALRVVHRYQGLPAAAKGGAAQDAMLERLERWIGVLGEGHDTAEARLALLRAAHDLATGPRQRLLGARVTKTRLALAMAKQAEWPLDALAILVDPAAGAPVGEAVEAADKIIERLVASPSLLLDAGSDLDAWSIATHAAELRSKATQLREESQEGRTAAEVEGVTPNQLAEMCARRPWDQYAALQLAHSEAAGGQLDAAATRLTKLGAPGMTIRQARFALAQITAAQGKLEAADAQLSTLLDARLPRFIAASAALQAAGRLAQERIETALKTGDVPLELRRRVEAASESEQSALIRSWAEAEMTSDAGLLAARARYTALGDIVPVALAAGSIKLRRAHGMSGPARDAMLQAAERTFLAIRTEAEGQPSFRLALGEIYARLGKTAESEAELAVVLANPEPELRMQVANVYRAIGSDTRAKQIVTEVFSTASSPVKETAAHMLAIIVDDEDEAEGWYRKADQQNPDVKAALLGHEGRRLEREGKATECAAKQIAAAKLFLGTASAAQTSGYNNAALAYERSFDCSSDPKALRDAEAALETAYRRAPEDAIVVSNLTYVHLVNGQIRVLARHFDLRALRLKLNEVGEILDGLPGGPERTALLAEIAADPSTRRAVEMLAQLEVLMPNSPRSYQLRFREAHRKRNVEGAAFVVERARQAKALDVSAVAAERARWLSGADDAKHLAAPLHTRARLEAILAQPGANRLAAKTRGVAWYLLADALMTIGVFQNDNAALQRGREAATMASRLWPALAGDRVIVVSLINEAGLDSDAKAWIASRRLRSTTGALAQLVADGDPLAAKIRASKQWTDVAAHAKVDPVHPSLDDLRLARLLGDAALEARARPVLDDKLVRLSLELNLLLDPSDPVVKQDLAYFDRR
jgi:hypothetical protein